MDIEINQFEVYGPMDQFLGKVPVRMWNGTPPKYIMFNDLMCEFDAERKRYIVEDKNGK